MNYKPDNFIQPTEIEIVISPALTIRVKKAMIYIIYLGGVYNANGFSEKRDSSPPQAD
jgi:hypothetical protein